MTPPLIDVIARPPATAAAESVSPALPVSPALLMPGALGRGSGIRFGDALRAQATDAGTGAVAMAEGAEAAASEVHIDDVDILRQLTGAGMNAAALRGHLGDVRDGSAEPSDESADSTDVAAANVDMASGSAVAPGAPLAPAFASPAGLLAVADAAQGDTRAAVAPARIPGPSRRAPDFGATMELSPEDIGDLAAPPLAISRQGSGGPNRNAGAAGALPIGSFAPAAEPGVVVLASQSQVPLLALPSAAGDPARAVSASPDVPAAAQSPTVASRQTLVQALGERLHVQLSRGSSQAVIRLDPPMMGTIEIVIRQDAGGVQVHLSASHSEVLRQLHGIGGALSQDLIQRNHGEVAVHVSQSTRDAEGRQRQRQGGAEENDSRPGRALHMASESDRVAFTL